jgi:hypothetical protein
MSARCALTKFVSTQKLRRDNLKLLYARSAYVSARCALTESILTQKFKRDKLRVCVGGKHAQCHIVQEKQLSCGRIVARSAQSPFKSQVEGIFPQGVHRVDIWLSLVEVIMRSSEC